MWQELVGASVVALALVLIVMLLLVGAAMRDEVAAEIRLRRWRRHCRRDERRHEDLRRDLDRLGGRPARRHF